MINYRCISCGVESNSVSIHVDARRGLLIQCSNWAGRGCAGCADLGTLREFVAEHPEREDVRTVVAWLEAAPLATFDVRPPVPVARKVKRPQGKRLVATN